MKRQRWTTPALLAALVLLLPATAVGGLLELTYLQRLRMPVASDDIGYGQSVTADPHTGEVFVCDPRSDRILIFDADGNFSFQILGGIDFSNPRDIAVHPEGYLVVLVNLDARSVPVELDFDGKFIRPIDLWPVSEDLIDSRFVSVAISPDGEQIFLLDDGNLDIWIVASTGEVIDRVSLRAGMSDEEGEEIIVGQIDVYGSHLLVALPSHSEIRKYSLEGKLLDRVGIKGVSACKLGRPTAAALTESGEYLIIDQQRMFLVHWSATGNQCLGDYIGIGAAPGYLYYPNDLSLGVEGDLYIAQSFDGRVQKYTGLPRAAGPGAGKSTADSSEKR